MRKNLAILGLFAALTVVMTWPLARYAASAIAGPPGDGFIHLYEMYWFKRAIFDLQRWPLFDPEMFYPIGYNMGLSHITPSNTLPMMPVVLLAGPIAGFNGAVFLSFALSAFGAYLLALRFTRNRWAGIVAGIMFAFSAYRFHNLGAGWLPNLGTQWLPFAILYLDKVIARPRRPLRDGALAGFFFALVCLSSWYHVYIAGLALVAYLLARARPWRQCLLARTTLAGGVAFSVVAVLLILPLAMPLLQFGVGEDKMDWPLSQADEASASIDDLFLPSIYNTLWGDTLSRRRETTYAAVAPGLVYLGLPALALALYGLRRRAAGSGPFWAIGIIGAVLTLGLTLHANGLRLYIPVPASVEESFSRAMLTLAGKLALNPGSYWAFRQEGGIPLPLPGMLFSLFAPFGGTMRVFHRFALDSSLAVAILAGMGTAALWRPGVRRRIGRLLGPALAVLVALDCLAAPLVYGVSSARGSAIDQWLSKQPGDFSVLHLPLIRSLNGPSLYRAVIHGKKISYGYGTFYPTEWRQAVTPLGEFPNDEALALLRSWHVRYVFIGEGAYRAGLVDSPGDTWDKVQQRLAASSGLRYVQTIDEQSPVVGDTLSPRLSKPWPLEGVVIDRTRVYEVLP